MNLRIDLKRNRRAPRATGGRPNCEMNRRIGAGSERSERPLRRGFVGLILACCCLVPLLAASSFGASEPIQYVLDLQ